MSKSKPAWPRMDGPAAGHRAAAAARPAAAPAGSGTRRAGRPGRWRAPITQAAIVMPSNTGVGVAAQQHPVLEGAGLAFVGIAHHHVLAARRLAAQRPLKAGGKTGAAAAAQVASASSRPACLGAPRQGGAQRRTRRRGPASSTSARRTLSCTSNQAAGHDATGTCRCTRSASCRRGAASSRVTTWWWLTSSAGPWSHRPVHEVVSTLTRPSARTRPGATPRRRHRSAISASLPSRRSVMLSLNSTR
jgi:hypothetical protein